jgi:hypothetical protein
MNETKILAFYGTPITFKAPVKKIQLSIEQLQKTVAPKGSLYEIQLITSPLTPTQATQAIEKLTTEMKTQFGITTLYSIAAENEILMLIKGSPFAWAALLPWLPTILALLGITLVGVSAWQILIGIPTWLWALLIIGGALIVIGPSIGEFILKEVEKAQK